MKKLIGRLAGTLLALALTSGLAAAQSKITVAVGGGACLCYLPTVLAKQLGEFDKAGLNGCVIPCRVDAVRTPDPRARRRLMDPKESGSCRPLRPPLLRSRGLRANPRELHLRRGGRDRRPSNTPTVQERPSWHLPER